MDVKEFPEDVDVTLVEGAVANEEHLTQIQLIRERTKILVSFGDCAVTGNVTAMRNPFGVPRPCSTAPTSRTRTLQPRRARRSRVVPALLDRVRPVHEVVKVDYYLPGCPPSADLIHFVLTELARPAACRTSATGQVRRRGATMGQRIVIDPVTRIEGHAKITIILDDQGEVVRRPVPRHRVPRLREVLRGPALPRDAGHHLPHLRHLPRQPHARLGQGLRRAAGRRDPARRPPSCARLVNYGADPPVARALASSTSPRPTCCSASTPTPRSATSWA